MATKLYFNAGSSDVTSRPSDQQSTVTPGSRWDPTFSMLPLGLYPPNGGDLTSTISSLASTSLQKALMQAGISPSLSGSGTIGGGTVVLYAAESESSTNANFFINAINAYVWRPGTGSKVGTIKNSVTGSSSLGGLKPTSADSTQVTYISSITSSGVNYQDGDCIIVELWSLFAQSMATSYSCDVHYGGWNETLSENSVLDISGCASFIQFNEDVSFKNQRIVANRLMMTGCGI